MKTLNLVIIILVFIFGTCYSYAQEWYEYEEASCSRPDYVGSIDKQVRDVSDGSEYTPEYSAAELQETMIERDLNRTASVADASSRSDVLDIPDGAMVGVAGTDVVE